MVLNLDTFGTGICDRLRALTFSAAIAELIHDKDLYVYEESSSECPDRIIDLFDLKGFKIHSLQMPEKSQIMMNPFNSFPCLDAVQRNVPDYITVSARQVFGLWVDSYKLLIPKPKFTIVNRALSFSYSFGIHLRTTDRLGRLPGKGVITKSQLKKFVYKFLPDILSSTSPLHNVYICSDSALVLREVLAVLSGGVELITNPGNRIPKGSRESDGEYFLYDLFSLSRCEKIYSTVGGGVPLTANLIAGRNFSDADTGWAASCWDTRAFDVMRKMKRFFPVGSKAVP